MSARVLQVDVSGQPLGLIHWHRAVNMLWQGNATVLYEAEEGSWKSPSWEQKKALIIQTHEYVRLRPLKENVIVRRVLLARDNWQCQYCLCSLTLASSTIDHVKPKIAYIKEGRPASDAHRWDNVVASCGPCNTKKGGRTPHQSGMMPKCTPAMPTYVATRWGGRVNHPIHAEYVAEWYKVDVDLVMRKKNAV